MDAEKFVQNIKFLCLQNGVKPTIACKESGVGGSFINDIERGRVPSVAKVQMLARYLGVTTSQLLGEEMPAGGEGEESPQRRKAHRLVDQTSDDALRDLLPALEKLLG